MFLNYGVGKDSWESLGLQGIQPVHPKGNQFWIFIGRTDVEAEAPILWCSAFFTVQLSHPYMTTGKTVALTRWTFIGKVMSLLFNMLSRLVTTFLPTSKCLLISWLQSSSAVILEPQKTKSETVSTVSPSISYQLRACKCGSTIEDHQTHKELSPMI